MKILLKYLPILLPAIGVLGLGLSVGGTSLKSKGKEELHYRREKAYQDSISTVKNSFMVAHELHCPDCDSLISIVRKAADSTLKAKIDSIVRAKNTEVRKAYLIGTKTCPECDNTPVKFLDYEINKDSLFVKTNKGTITGKVKHEIGVKPFNKK